jgi:aspartyl protease family protein
MKLKLFFVMLMSLLALPALAETRLNVVGLFSNKALVSINGAAPRSLSAGQTVDGVKLISANSDAATFMVEGKRQTLKMGQAASVAGGGGPQNNDPVSLYADSRGHFSGNLTINGVSLKYLVDTGATTIALNSGDAKYAKIDYEKGEQVPVSTANGIVTAYLVKLNTVKIGTITFNIVEATVNEGGSPSVVLLGMSALNRLDMRRDNSIMTLTKKY